MAGRRLRIQHRTGYRYASPVVSSFNEVRMTPLDDDGQVLDTQGRPLGGLYAVGNVSAAAMGRTYPGAGATLGPAMTFGWRAARHAMRVND